MHSQPKKLFATIALAATAIVYVVLTAWPAQAAVELLYFRARASTNTVLLEWATANETNISGYIIECKREDEPDTEYHPIGARDALGSPERGAEYSFNVAGGMEPGVSYCFRLVETTIDGLPGEQFEICGYGAAVTPTPVGTPGAPGFGDGTPSTIIVVPPLGANGEFEPTPLFTATPLPTVDPFATPTPSPTPTSLDGPISPLDPQSVPQATTQPTAEFTPTQPFSPLPTNSEASAAQAAATGDSTGTMQGMGEAGTSQTEGITATATATGTTPAQASSPLETPQLPTVEPTQTPEPSPTDVAQPGSVAEPDATSTPLYVVLTATPTSAITETAALAPTFTPWPTITPEPEMNLASLLNPSAQNLMVALLCVIFLTASGLGTLGLVTSVIYMRSRAQREEYLTRLYNRRRF